MSENHILLEGGTNHGKKIKIPVDLNYISRIKKNTLKRNQKELQLNNFEVYEKNRKVEKWKNGL